MIVEWKGKIGYGDVVSPLCYAQNQSEIRGEKTTLRFHWPYADSKDPESLPKRVDTLIDKIKFPGVEVVHAFDSYVSYDHINYDVKPRNDAYKYHNVYFPKVNVDPKKYVVCSPIYNQKSLKEYGKKWKDRLTFDEWYGILEQYDAIHVDYRTPIEELLEVMSKCSHFIGYHGSCSWVARLFGLPMTIYSQDPKFSAWAFPWCNGSLSVEMAKFDRDEYIIENIRRLR